MFLYHHVHHLKLFWRIFGKFNAKINHQRGTSRLVPDDGMMEPIIDFAIQGIPHAAVEQDEDDRTRLIRRIVHQVMNHLKKEALIAILQNNRTCSPLSEESKKMNHNMGNVECFQLCETSLHQFSVHMV